MMIPSDVLSRFVANYVLSVTDAEAEMVQTIAHRIGTDVRFSDEGTAAMVTAGLLGLAGAPMEVRIIGGFWTRLYYRSRVN